MIDEEWMLLYLIDLYEGMDTRGRKYYATHQPNWTFGSGTTPADRLYDAEKVEIMKQLKDDAHERWQKVRKEKWDDE